jgi:hypothetical protein
MNLVARLFVAPDHRLRPAWRFWISLVVVVLANGFAIALTFLAAGKHHPTWFEVIFRTAWLAFMLLGFSGMLYLLDRVRRNLLASMGLAFDGAALRESFQGMALGAGMVVTSVAAIAVAGHVEFHWVGGGARVAVAMVVVTGITAIAAMAEEVAFRGYPFQRLVEGIGSVGGIVFLSVLFGAVHLGNPHATLWGFLNTIEIGALLALAYLRTRSLWMPWGVHFGWNLALGLGFGLPVSGMDDFAVAVRGTAEGPVWLTGGSYGIEASLTGSVVILAGVLVLLRLTPSRPAPTLANPPQEANHSLNSSAEGSG